MVPRIRTCFGNIREKHVLRWAVAAAVLILSVRSIVVEFPFLVLKGSTTLGNNDGSNTNGRIGSPTTTIKVSPQWRPRPKMTLFVRMSGTMAKHRRRFFCTFFRSTALFWNVMYSNQIILLLDDEVPTDHEFGNAISQQVAQEFPDFHLTVKYEPLPKDKYLLSKKSGQEKRPLGYRRQLYSSFLTDQYVVTDSGKADNEGEDNDDDTLIIFMDNDAMFFSPVTLSSILDEYNRPRILGSDCTYPLDHATKWYQSTLEILGFPMIMDFMSYFPVLIFADTIRNCRRYLMNRFGNTTNFEEAYPLISPPERNMSPVCVLLSYAWYFERDRYSWSFEVCGYPSDRNRAIDNPQHHIGAEHVTETLPVPQIAFHKPYSINESKVAHMTYCFATQYLMMASPKSKSSSSTQHQQQELPADCSDERQQQQEQPQQLKSLRYTFKDLFVLFVPNLQYLYRDGVEPPRCKGANEFDCVSRLERHFHNYVHEVQHEHRPPLDWSRTQRVSDMALHGWNITCSPIIEPPRS